jgi:hypothetical protein
MTRSLETQLKQLGLNSQSREYFQQNKFEFVNSSLLDFQQQIFDYVTRLSRENIRTSPTFPFYFYVFNLPLFLYFLFLTCQVVCFH